MSLSWELVGRGLGDPLSVNFSNVTVSETCPPSVAAGNCSLDSGAEETKRGVIATVRMIASLLSIGGSLSIIISIIIRKQVSIPKLRPLFVLSIADCLLSLMWVIGAIFWYANVQPPTWCFFASLPTVILECVTINLALVFALAAYSLLKKTKVEQLLSSIAVEPREIWTPFRVFLAYFLAWTIPIVLIMAAFGVISGMYEMTAQADDCACLCLPYFGNVIPFTYETSGPQALFFLHVRMLVASYGIILGTNYLIVFVILLIVYIRILRHIKRMRHINDQKKSLHPNYGTMDKLLATGESKAKRRVVYFILVFLITGFFNFGLSFVFVIYESIELRRGLHVKEYSDSALSPELLVLYLLQSVTMPLQGFFNALVYGWTRDEFREVIRKPVQVMRKKDSANKGKEVAHEEGDLYQTVSCGSSTEFDLSH